MVKLNRIYTRTGDDGTTGLGDGQRRRKDDLRITAFGIVDELNASVGVARLSIGSNVPEVDEKLQRIQNDLFDLGADLCVPPSSDEQKESESLRIVPAQVVRLENEIDELNQFLEPLRSFVLPGGSPASAFLHVSRTICRRAERSLVALSAQAGEQVGAPALHYVNRLSDFLFVAARYLNDKGASDILWKPGENR